MLAVVAMLLPTLVALAVIAVIRLGRLVAARRAPVVPADLPIERIAATARRLRAEEAELRSDYRGPGRQVRIAAASAAYVDVLGAACRALEVDPPRCNRAGRPFGGELARVESELGDRGLVLGPTG